jgi:stage V sporulation protein G
MLAVRHAQCPRAKVRGHIMEITDVRIFPVEEDRLKAYVTITLDNCFVVRDLKVVRGNSGLFVAMPAKRRKDGTFKDIAHPLNTETRAWMEEKILAAYHAEQGESADGDRPLAPGGAELRARGYDED